MTTTTFKKSRRDFLVTSAGVGGGLSLGFYMPSAFSQKVGAVEKSDVNIWVARGLRHYLVDWRMATGGKSS